MKSYVSKRFLNLDGYHSDASILTEIEFMYKDPSVGHTGQISIRDCSRNIYLSVGVDSEGDDNYVNSLHKVEVLIEELTKYRVELFKARAEFLRRKKKSEEDEKKQAIIPGTAGRRLPQGTIPSINPEGVRGTEIAAGNNDGDGSSYG